MFNRTFLRLAQNSQRRFRARIAIPTTTKHTGSTLMDIHIEERAGRKGGRGADDHRRGKAAGGRGGHGSGGGGGRGQVNREVAVSKALSKLLRHAAEDEGLVLDKEGFARLDQVVRFACLSFWRHLHLHLARLLEDFWVWSRAHTPIDDEHALVSFTDLLGR
jgi:hypothetical protein